MTEERRTSTEQVRQWREANRERARATSREGNRRTRDGSRQKWAEIARLAAAQDAEQDATR